MKFDVQRILLLSVIGLTAVLTGCAAKEEAKEPAMAPVSEQREEPKEAPMSQESEPQESESQESESQDHDEDQESTMHDGGCA